MPVNPSEIKKFVKQRYQDVACKHTASDPHLRLLFSEKDSVEPLKVNYSEVEGYHQEADLGLACGIPTTYAKIAAGDTVLDLGSGLGNDTFIAAHMVGPTGKVLGVDIAESMQERAEALAMKFGVTQVEFKTEDIEDLSIAANSIDVVISNNTINLIPDKAQAFKEIFRVLKPGGHFAVADIVLLGTLPLEISTHPELYVNCLAGAVLKEQYLECIIAAGFEGIQIHIQKHLCIIEGQISQYLPLEVVKSLNLGQIRLQNVVVVADKPIVA